MTADATNSEVIKAALIVQHECKDRRFMGGDGTCIVVVMHLAISQDHPIPLCGKRPRTRPYVTAPVQNLDAVEIPRICVYDNGNTLGWALKNGEMPILEGHRLCTHCAIKLFVARGGKPLSFAEYQETPAGEWLKRYRRARQ